jgi:hypothetical protein
VKFAGLPAPYFFKMEMILWGTETYSSKKDGEENEKKKLEISVYIKFICFTILILLHHFLADTDYLWNMDQYAQLGPVVTGT